MRFAICACLVALYLGIGVPSDAVMGGKVSVEKILQNVRAALGGPAFDRANSWHLAGSITIVGLKGTFEQWCDASTSSYAEFTNADAFTGVEAFDGTKAWSRDPGNVTWVDAGKAGTYSGIATAYLVNENYLRPSLRGSITFSGVQTNNGVRYDVLRATPPKGLPLDIWIDAQTNLPEKAVVAIGVQTTTLTFSDYRSVNGVKIPFHSHSVSDTGNETDAIVATAQANPPNPGSHIAMTLTRPDDYSLSGGSETVVPIQLIDNHVYLNVTINGKGPYQFAFDTGGANLIDSGIAKDLGLTTSGSMQGSGVGSQSEGFGFTKISSVGVGNATLRDQFFAVLPIRQSFSVAAGVPISGLIGFEVLSRFLTTFDYGNARLVLQLPDAAATAPAGADVIPFVFNSTIPQIACQLDGIAGDCSVDTGSRVAVSVLTPFSAAHPAVVPANATAPGIDGFGIGGAAIGRLGRLHSLQIGNTTLPDLITDFSVQTKGYFANPFIAANIGGGTWKRFSVTFDYAHQTMTLVPNKNFSDRDAYDRSGLFLIAPGGQVTIADVRPATPAADAGLVRGETVQSIDGKASSTLDLLSIRQLLSGPAGTVLHLDVVDKSGVPHSVSLTLRDYV